MKQNESNAPFIVYPIQDIQMFPHGYGGAFLYIHKESKN